MGMSFNEVPAGSRVPFSYVEFDSSKAQQGSATQPYKLLLLGIKSAAGTAAADTPVRVTSAAKAMELFGRGSMLHAMVARALDNNKFTELTVIPQAEPGAGTAASGTLTVTGPATAAGTLALYIAGQLVTVAVASGDIATVIATNINAAINAALDLPVTSTVNAAVVTVTFRHKGVVGNGLDIRLNYQDGDANPAGVAVAIVALANGLSQPVLTTSIAAMGEVQYNCIANPYLDATSLTAIEAELLDRWGAVRQNDGIAFGCKSDTHGNLVTFGATRNSKHVSTAGIEKSPSPAYEIAAAIAAVVAYYGAIDPARPFQTLPLKGIKAPAQADQFTLQERNLLLLGGIATLKADGGTVLIERVITMYQKNAQGAADTSYLDVNTLLTLSFIRWDWRNYMLTKYPRHKLANDGTRFSAGQAIITPKIGRAEALVKFRQWEENGLVEGVDQFKRDMIVERNAGDPNRMDWLLSPDLVNQLLVLGTQIGFLL